MESSSIKSLVFDIKKEVFLSGVYDKIGHNNDHNACVSPSAYDTAWLAMVPDISRRGPMFKRCLDWIVENQKEGGFWGEMGDDDDLPPIDALLATLAALLALKTWDLAHQNIQTGLDFIHSKVEEILRNNYESLPRWFIISFPAMIELATAAVLDLVFPPGSRDMIANIFIQRHLILEMEEIVDTSHSDNCFPPLLAYLETLPPTFHHPETVQRYLSYDGSLFQSPSASTQAFIITGNVDCLKYLNSLLQDFPNGGVPAKYPVDGDLIKLCLVDHVQGLGLAEHFNEDIEHILARVYRNRKDNNNSKPIETRQQTCIFQKLFKDALAFRLFRIQGHHVNPESFCWFLHEPEMVAYMEENSEQLTSTMYNVYRATDLQFSGESEMKEARTFSIKMLQNHNYNTIINNNRDQNLLITKGLQNMIKYELDVTWTARLDHLNHRKWIEENKTSPLWTGKSSFYRLSCLSNKKLLQLAIENFEFRQSIYRQELEILKGWSKKWGLSEMGIGREKTVYCYFSVAAATCSCISEDSIFRLVLAKATIIVTVADDFYDMEGSLTELETLTDAVKRWDSTKLQGHGKTIFDALDDLVNEIAANCRNPWERSKVMTKLQHLWRETFISWMVERDWSLKGYLPSMDEYLTTGTLSIAAHTISLPATNFFSQQNGTILEYHDITKLLMDIARLVNDTTSYEKEEADGKINLVLLHLKENPNAKIEDSIAYVNQIIDMKRKKFLEQVFMDVDMQKPCKQIHLACMKVFHMFYSSAKNLFDREDELIDEIERAIYDPIVRKPKTEPFLKPISSIPLKKTQETSKILNGDGPIMKQSCIMTTNHLVKRFNENLPSSAGQKIMNVSMKFNLCFI